jgi:hypothetical protein
MLRRRLNLVSVGSLPPFSVFAKLQILNHKSAILNGIQLLSALWRGIATIE